MEDVLVQLKDIINQFLYDEIDYVLGFSGQLIQIFSFLMAIGCVYRVFINAFNSPGDIWGYFKWIFLVILFFNYDKIIIALFEFSKQADQNVSLYAQATTLLSIIFSGFNILTDEAGDISLIDLSFTILTNVINGLIFKNFSIILLYLSVIISYLIYFYYKIKVLVKILFLTIFGPVNIALSALPAFEGQWKHWIADLIQTCLYLPILFIIDWLGLELLNKAFNPVINSGISQVMITWAGIMFFAMLIGGYFFIEKISKMVIYQVSESSLSKRAVATAVTLGRKVITGGI